MINLQQIRHWLLVPHPGDGQESSTHTHHYGDFDSVLLAGQKLADTTGNMIQLYPAEEEIPFVNPRLEKIKGEQGT